MTPADHARNNAISLEAKKDRLVQLQSNDWKVTFTVQTIDMDARLTQAPMGTRYAVVLVEIGDNEEPVQKEARAALRQADPPSSRPDGAKRPWRDLQPATQAAIRCNEPSFRAFLTEEHSFRPRQGHDSADEAAEFLRSLFGITSRSELGTDPRRRVLWKQMDDSFSVWLAKERVGA